MRSREVPLPIRLRREQAPYPAGGRILHRRVTVFAPKARKGRRGSTSEGSCSLQRLGCTPPGSVQQYGLAAKVQIEQARPSISVRSSGRRRNLHEGSRHGIDVCGGPEGNRWNTVAGQPGRPSRRGGRTEYRRLVRGLTLLPRMGCSCFRPQASAASATVDVSSTVLGSSTIVARRSRAISSAGKTSDLTSL